MAYTLTASGISHTSGRGANAVTLVYSFREIEDWAKRMRKDEKELWRLSYGRAVAGLKKKFIQVMTAGGGVNGVPKFRDFEDFTKELRGVRGRTEPMGGILADRKKRGTFVAYKRNGAQVIGWGDHLASVATAFQDGRGGPDAERYFTDRDFRRSLHRVGVKHIPRAYVHNPRMVIEPYFLDYVRANLDDWAKSAYYAGLVKLMQGKRDSRFERANLK